MSLPRPLLALVILIAISTQTAHAQLKSERGTVSRDSAQTISLKAKSFGKSNSASHPWAWVFEGKGDEGNSVLGWSIADRKFISAIVAYLPDLAPLEDCEPDDSALPNAYCEGIVERHMMCHLLLFDAKTLEQLLTTPLEIRRDPGSIKGKPRCDSIKAMASGGYAAPQMMLVTLGYIDSAELPEARRDPPEFLITVAVQLDSTQGPLLARQRNECLGNPNRLSTIAAARKRLAECASEGSPTGE